MAETEQTIAILREAVIMRLAGEPWFKVAEATGRVEGTCKRWPITHRTLWNQLWEELTPTIESVILGKGHGALAVLERLAQDAESDSVKVSAAGKLADLTGKLLTQKTDANVHGEGLKIVFSEGGVEQEGASEGEGT